MLEVIQSRRLAKVQESRENVFTVSLVSVSLRLLDAQNVTKKIASNKKKQKNKKIHLTLSFLIGLKLKVVKPLNKMREGE